MPAYLDVVDGELHDRPPLAAEGGARVVVQLTQSRQGVLVALKLYEAEAL